jgi:triacylglycerol esterase/lipase EstA (alpha/beta hydrolase family)
MGSVPAVLSSLSAARRRLVLGLLTAVVVAAVAGGIAAAVGSGSGSGDRALGSVSPDAPGPVLLVPGYGGSTKSLNTLAAGLRARGKDVTVVSLPGSGTGDLRVQAQVLARAATDARDRTHAGSVDVVGYSAGGVVARIWLRDEGGSSIARRVVTLGAPQHGTELAGLGELFPSACPTACQQLQPDSPLLASLNRGSETPSGPSVVSIWTTQDDVVLPPDSARLEGALNITVQSICPSADVSHTGLPASRLVDAMVAAELAPGAPVSLTAADCGRLSS